MKHFVKTISVILSIILCFSVCTNLGCKESESEAKKDCVDIWFESSTAKIFREEDVADKSLKQLTLTMAKNEYEGGQLLMFAKENVNEYTVEVSDLINGNNVITKDNISIFNVKYISSEGVSTQYINESLPQGSEMPDAILPFKTACEFGENKIPKGKNQAVYIEVFAPSNIASGVYKGKITLYVDGYNYFANITVNVHDFVIPNEPSTMNYMALWDSSQYASTELDSSTEMDTVYFEKLLQYRMSSMLPFNGEGGTAKYVELLRKYYNWTGFCCYKFFYEPTYSTYNGEMIQINISLLKEYLTAVVKASLEDRVDYLSKAIFYFSTAIDEPGEGDWPKVRIFSTVVHSVLEDLAKELDVTLLKEGIKNYDFYVTNVRDSLVSLQNTLPCAASIDKLAEENCLDITAINGLQLFNTESDRANYLREGRKTWFYTCIGPQYPYPNLLANNWLTSVREISWMQKCYDIDGFLVWSTANYTTSDNGGKPVVENYAKLSNTMTGVSDGKIFYPGYPYDIYGPVSSLRAVAYRDGMEDYEILQAIYEKYEKQNLDAKTVLQEYYDKLFSGVVPNFDANFISIREEVFNILDSLESDYAIYYNEISYAGSYATIKFSVVNENASVSVNGNSVNKDQNGIYSVTINDKEYNYINIDVTVAGKTKSYKKYIFGTYELVTDFESGTQNAVKVNARGSLAVVNSDKCRGDKALEITLNGYIDITNSFMPWFSVELSSLPDIKTVTSLCMSIYSPKDISFEIYARYLDGGVSYEELFSRVNLKAGLSDIEVEIPSGIKDIEGLQSFRFKTDNIVDTLGVPSSLKILVDDLAYRVDKYINETVSLEKGEILSSKSSYEERNKSKLKQYKVIENDVSNVIEGDYLLMADFENYNQIAQLRFNNNFGKLEMVSDSKYVTHGKYALKMTIDGYGEKIGHYDPTMFIYTSLDYFQVNNISNFDYVEVDMYNEMDYELCVRFNLTWIYFAKGYDYESFVLQPGMNHIKIPLEKLKSCYGDEIPYFCFVFDRGELHEEKQVIYIDDFKCHLINK